MAENNVVERVVAETNYIRNFLFDKGTVILLWALNIKIYTLGCIILN